MKKSLKQFIKLSVLVVLIAVTALSLLSFNDKNEELDTEITIYIDVTGKDGETKTFEITTRKTTLADAVVESGLVENTMDQYGLAIITVNGETADFNTDGSYWALYKDNEYLMTGASQTKIADGDKYQFIYTIY